MVAYPIKTSFFSIFRARFHLLLLSFVFADALLRLHWTFSSENANLSFDFAKSFLRFY